jgi:hypothetical protein
VDRTTSTKAGEQNAYSWQAGESGVGSIFTGTALPPDRCYVAVITGSNVLLRIRTGTAETNELTDIQVPARFAAWGTLEIFAKQDNNLLPAEVRPMIGYGSGGMVPDVAAVRTGPFNLEPSAVALRAVSAGLTGTVRGVPFALIAGQAIELRGPATLIAGTATVQYEP